MFFSYAYFQRSQKHHCYELSWYTLFQECFSSRSKNSQHVLYRVWNHSAAPRGFKPGKNTAARVLNINSPKSQHPCIVPRPLSVFHLSQSVSGHVVGHCRSLSVTSPERIDREGLEESRTGTRQPPPHLQTSFSNLLIFSKHI